MAVRTHLLCFIILSFQSLDSLIVRKECVPLVSISIWHNLSSEALRDSKLAQQPHLRKAWKACLKRYDAADDATKARLRFDRTWLCALVLIYLEMVQAGSGNDGMSTLHFSVVFALSKLTITRRHHLLRTVYRIPS